MHKWVTLIGLLCGGLAWAGDELSFRIVPAQPTTQSYITLEIASGPCPGIEYINHQIDGFQIDVVAGVQTDVGCVLLPPETVWYPQALGQLSEGTHTLNLLFENQMHELVFVVQGAPAAVSTNSMIGLVILVWLLLSLGLWMRTPTSVKTKSLKTDD